MTYITDFIDKNGSLDKVLKITREEWEKIYNKNH